MMHRPCIPTDDGPWEDVPLRDWSVLKARSNLSTTWTTPDNNNDPCGWKTHHAKHAKYAKYAKYAKDGGRLCSTNLSLIATAVCVLLAVDTTWRAYAIRGTPEVRESLRVGKNWHQLCNELPDFAVLDMSSFCAAMIVWDTRGVSWNCLYLAMGRGLGGRILTPMWCLVGLPDPFDRHPIQTWCSSVPPTTGAWSHWLAFSVQRLFHLLCDEFIRWSQVFQWVVFLILLLGVVFLFYWAVTVLPYRRGEPSRYRPPERVIDQVYPDIRDIP